MSGNARRGNGAARALRFLFAAAAAVPMTTQAETALELVSACRPITNAEIPEPGKVVLPRTFSAGTCWGAFAFAQEGTTYRSQDGMSWFGACPPDDSTRVQLISIFVAYAEKNPRRLHEGAISVVRAALTEAFPCRKRK